MATRKIFALLTLWTLVSLVPSFVSAANPTCQCFCTSANGAVDTGQKELGACSQSCTDKQEKMITCAASASQYPGNAPRCFTTERCTAQGGEFDTTQPKECPSGLHYCYAKSETPISLSVAIGPVKTVTDYGAYIGRIYTYLLGVGITIAIVFTMIGGIQYVVAAGTGEVEEAKTRIRNAIVGLIILFSAYVILYTVNPNLVKLQAPRLPMVKTVASAGADSCETFKTNGYKLDPPNGACGRVATIQTGPQGEQVVGGSTCQYRFCPTGMSCFGDGDSAECLSCTEAVPNNSKGVTPSSTLCKALKSPDEFTPAGNLRVGNYCFHSYDPSLLNFWGLSSGQGTTIAANIGTCAQMKIDCRNIQKCDNYEDVVVQAGNHTVKLEDLEPAGALNLGGDYDLQFVCELNPCRSLGLSLELRQGCKYASYGGTADECEPK